MMEVIKFFFSGPQWFLHFICLCILCYVISPTVEHNYYYDGTDGDVSGGDQETSTSKNDNQVSKK